MTRSRRKKGRSVGGVEVENGSKGAVDGWRAADSGISRCHLGGGPRAEREDARGCSAGTAGRHGRGCARPVQGETGRARPAFSGASLDACRGSGPGGLHGGPGRAGPRRRLPLDGGRRGGLRVHPEQGLPTPAGEGGGDPRGGAERAHGPHGGQLRAGRQRLRARRPGAPASDPPPPRGGSRRRELLRDAGHRRPGPRGGPPCPQPELLDHEGRGRAAVRSNPGPPCGHPHRIGDPRPLLRPGACDDRLRLRDDRRRPTASGRASGRGRR
jgi:hypothetical protein